MTLYYYPRRIWISFSVGSTKHIPLRKLSTSYVVITKDPEYGSKSQTALSTIEDNTTIKLHLEWRRIIHWTSTLMKKNLLQRRSVHTHYQSFRNLSYWTRHNESDFPIVTFSGNGCNTLNNKRWMRSRDRVNTTSLQRRPCIQSTVKFTWQRHMHPII